MNELADEITQQSDEYVFPGSTRSWTRTGRGGVQEYTSKMHVVQRTLGWRSGSSTILPGWTTTRGCPGLHPQYTRADFGQEAVGGPNNSTSPTQRQGVKLEREHENRAQQHADELCQACLFFHVFLFCDVCHMCLDDIFPVMLFSFFVFSSSLLLILFMFFLLFYFFLCGMIGICLIIAARARTLLPARPSVSHFILTGTRTTCEHKSLGV